MKIDFINQSTGYHSWNVSSGWANTAKMNSILNHVFNPRAEWNKHNTLNDDGLFDYLSSPKSDLIILLGFDWHSQALHMSDKWKAKWQNVKIPKVMYAQESILNHEKMFKNKDMLLAYESALSCVDFVIYTDINDASLVEKSKKPSLWLPFGVDHYTFKPLKNFKERKKLAYFRGKTSGWSKENNVYGTRALMVDTLQKLGFIDVKPYENKQLEVADLVNEFNDYKISVNFPSVFLNHTTRVFESLACRNILITNSTGNLQVDNLFNNGEHLFYYSNLDELCNIMEKQIDFPNEKVSENGYLYTLDNFTLEKQINTIIKTIL